MIEKKQSLTFYISVEGEVCELYYFKHLQKLINNSNKNVFNVNLITKQKRPISFAKSITMLYKDEYNSDFFHIQDIECYNTHYEKFKSLINEIEKTSEDFGIKYTLGYTNFTFELWIILHKIDLFFEIADRRKYVKYINQAFNKCYGYIDEYKSKDEFLKILDFIKIDDVIEAIRRAKLIRQQHLENQHGLINYKSFKFYKENPDLTIHLCVEKILEECGILKKDI